MASICGTIRIKKGIATAMAKIAREQRKRLVKKAGQRLRIGGRTSESSEGGLESGSQEGDGVWGKSVSANSGVEREG